VQLRGGFATVEDRSGNLYFAAQLRKSARRDRGVLTAWLVTSVPSWPLSTEAALRVPNYDTFVAQQRSLYVPGRRRRLLQARSGKVTHDRGDADALRRAIGSRRAPYTLSALRRPGRSHDTVTQYSLTTDENGDWLFASRGTGRWLKSGFSHNRRSHATATRPSRALELAHRREPGRIREAVPLDEVAGYRGDQRDDLGGADVESDELHHVLGGPPPSSSTAGNIAKRVEPAGAGARAGPVDEHDALVGRQQHVVAANIAVDQAIPGRRAFPSRFGRRGARAGESRHQGIVHAPGASAAIVRQPTNIDP